MLQICLCMNDHPSDMLHLGEGVEVPGLVGSDAEIDDSSGEAVPQSLGKLSVPDSHQLYLNNIDYHTRTNLSQRRQDSPVLVYDQLALLQLSYGNLEQFFKEGQEVLVDFFWPAVEDSSLGGRVGRDAIISFLGLALKQSDHLEPSFSSARNDLTISFRLFGFDQLMVEYFVAVAIGINQQAMMVILFHLVEHPNKWRYSCPKRNYDVVLFEFSWCDLSWQNPSLPYLSLAFVQIMAAQATVQPSLSYLVLHQFDKQINVPSLHPRNGVLPADDFIDIPNKIPEIQLQLEILDKLYDVALVLLDKIEVFLVILLELKQLLAEEWIVGGVYEGLGRFVDEEVVVYDEANVQMGCEELVEGEEVAVVVDCLLAGFGEVVEHEDYVFLSVVREDFDDVSLFYEFVGRQQLQLGPVCPSVLSRGQFLHFLNCKLHFLVSIPQTQPNTLNVSTVFLNDPLFFNKAADLVSPAAQIHFSISLCVHIIAQPNLNKLLPSQHLQSLPQLPRSHTEVLTVRAIPKRIDRKFYLIIECEALLHEFFPEGSHVVGRTALTGSRDEEDPNASVQGKMAVELLN